MIYSDIWTNRGKTVLDCLNVNGHKKYRENWDPQSTSFI
jgi:hypothetical protein